MARDEVNRNMNLYRRIIRPLLFTLPAEYAYHLGTDALRPRMVWKALAAIGAFRAPDSPVEVAGIALKNPIGLAAGFDKDCNILPSLAALGFGYLTCGTVTREVRAGNPSPRLLRDVDGEAIINSFGFPSVGLEVARSELGKRARARQRRSHRSERIRNRDWRHRSLPPSPSTAVRSGRGQHKLSKHGGASYVPRHPRSPRVARRHQRRQDAPPVRQDAALPVPRVGPGRPQPYPIPSRHLRGRGR